MGSLVLSRSPVQPALAARSTSTHACSCTLFLGTHLALPAATTTTHIKTHHASTATSSSCTSHATPLQPGCGAASRQCVTSRPAPRRLASSAAGLSDGVRGTCGPSLNPGGDQRAGMCAHVGMWTSRGCCTSSRSARRDTRERSYMMRRLEGEVGCKACLVSLEISILSRSPPSSGLPVTHLGAQPASWPQRGQQLPHRPRAPPRGLHLGAHVGACEGSGDNKGLVTSVLLVTQRGSQRREGTVGVVSKKATRIPDQRLGSGTSCTVAAVLQISTPLKKHSVSPLSLSAPRNTPTCQRRPLVIHTRRPRQHPPTPGRSTPHTCAPYALTAPPPAPPNPAALHGTSRHTHAPAPSPSTMTTSKPCGAASSSGPRQPGARGAEGSAKGRARRPRLAGAATSLSTPHTWGRGEMGSNGSRNQ